MPKRKPLSKSTRFEVFKRDGFRCQYCGRSAPDVVLEVDHIIPVAKGGDDDIMNLVTSCRDCNRGKSAKELTDDTVIRKQKAELESLNAKREQMEMMIKWREELRAVVNEQVDSVDRIVRAYTADKYYLNEIGVQTIGKLIRRFSYEEVYDACVIAFDRYYSGDIESVEYAINKIGGVCYNRRKQSGEG